MYPIATPAAAVLYLGTMVASHPMWLLRPLVLAIAIGLVLIIVLTVLLRDKHRAGLAAWALLVGLIANDLRASALLFAVAAVVITIGIPQRGRPWARSTSRAYLSSMRECEPDATSCRAAHRSERQRSRRRW